jgi:hypothetical protein
MGSTIVVRMIHLQQALLILALMLGAPALADSLTFYKSDAKSDELERTRHACMLQSLQPSGEEAVWLFIACMKARGWHLREQSPAPAVD